MSVWFYVCVRACECVRAYCVALCLSVFFAFLRNFFTTTTQYLSCVFAVTGCINVCICEHCWYSNFIIRVLSTYLLSPSLVLFSCGEQFSLWTHLKEEKFKLKFFHRHFKSFSTKEKEILFLQKRACGPRRRLFAFLIGMNCSCIAVLEVIHSLYSSHVPSTPLSVFWVHKGPFSIQCVLFSSSAR